MILNARAPPAKHKKTEKIILLEERRGQTLFTIYIWMRFSARMFSPFSFENVQNYRRKGRLTFFQCPM